MTRHDPASLAVIGPAAAGVDSSDARLFRSTDPWHAREPALVEAHGRRRHVPL